MILGKHAMCGKHVKCRNGDITCIKCKNTEEYAASGCASSGLLLK